MSVGVSAGVSAEVSAGVEGLKEKLELRICHFKVVLSGVEVDSLADGIGFSYIQYMLTQSAYCKHLFHLGNNFPEFINNLDSIHSFIAQRAQVGSL